MGYARKVERNRWREAAKKKIMKFPMFAETIPNIERFCTSAQNVPKMPRAVGELVVKKTNWAWWRDANRRARTAAQAKAALEQVPGDA